MNGYSNADTYFVAAAIANIESLYFAAKRITNTFALRNLVADAQQTRMIGDDIDLESVDFEEVLDSVLEE